MYGTEKVCNVQYFALCNLHLTLEHLVSTKRSYILKQTCTFYMQWVHYKMLCIYSVNQASAEKKAHLVEANRQQDFNTEIVNLDKWVEEIHNSLKDKETGTDITTTRALYNKHKVMVLSF